MFRTLAKCAQVCQRQSLPLLQFVSSSTLFDASGPVPKVVTSEPSLLHSIHRYCSAAILIAPAFASRFFGFFSQLTRALVASPSTDAALDALDIALALGEACAGQASKDGQGISWMYLPAFPTAMEVFEQPPLESVASLPVVCSAYPSHDAYMDTYFRLVRADAFQHMLVKIHELRGAAGSEESELKGVVRVTLAGMVLPDKPHHEIALQLDSPSQEISSPLLAKRLEHGRLCCIVAGESERQECFWATVVKSNTVEATVAVTVIAAAPTMRGEVVQDPLLRLMLKMLSATPTFLILPPRVPLDHLPVLRGLQSIGTSVSVLREELRLAEPIELSEPGEFLTQQTGVVIEMHDYKVQATVEEAARLLESQPDQFYQNFDTGQIAALHSLLTHRITIVHGSPGTGKTHTTLAMLRMVLSMDPAPRSPILVLAPTGRLLDEWMRRCIESVTPDVAHLGRGYSSAFPNKSVSALRKELRADPEFAKQSAQIFNEFNEVASRLRAAVKAFRSRQQKTNGNRFETPDARLFLEQFSEVQIGYIVLGHDWDNQPDAAEGQFTRKQIKQRVSAERKLLAENAAIKDHVLENPESPFACWFTEVFDKAIRAWFPPKGQFERLQPVRVGAFVPKKLDKRSRIAQDDQLALDEEEVLDGDSRTEHGSRISEGVLKLTTQDGAPELLFPAFDMSTVCSESVATSLLECDDPWLLSPDQRACLALLLHHRSVDSSNDHMVQIMQELRRTRRDLEAARESQTILALQKCDVLCATVADACNNFELLARLQPSVVIVDGATQITEAELITCLGSWAQRLVLIGDQDLKPTLASPALATHQLNKSMLERLVDANYPHVQLQTQHRIESAVAPLLAVMYGPVDEPPRPFKWPSNDPTEIIPPLFWYDHADLETRCNSSLKNEGEAKRVGYLVSTLVRSGYQSNQIAVVCAHTAQAELVSGYLVHSEAFGIRVATIESFDGCESEVVVLSLVRSNLQGRIGALNSPALVRTALSRAKRAVCIVGSKKTFHDSGNDSWQAVIAHLESYEMGLVSRALSLRCPHHSGEVQQIERMETQRWFCRHRCTFQYELCKHPCDEPCHKMVQGQHPDALHAQCPACLGIQNQNK
eukprot:c11794_g1_i1.p1 GENE.c11794_g1_i1~~c11794_g1_i1.p1  ORF type:complete len:1213 (-),score=282.23 c11794_g1_i1:20-3346(-)